MDDEQARHDAMLRGFLFGGDDTRIRGRFGRRPPARPASLPSLPTGRANWVNVPSAGDRRRELLALQQAQLAEQQAARQARQLARAARRRPPGIGLISG